MKRKMLILLAVLLVCAMLFMLLAHFVQTDMGRVRVSEGTIQSDAGDLYYKLYTPKSATPENPAPAVLLLHGYLNDHETNATYAIELARRGVVVMSIDEYGHGFTAPGLLARGYVNHKVTVNYGNDSEEDGTYVKIGGQERYRIMMNFSNLTFFNDHYSKDDEGHSITDSSGGGIAAYAVLAGMENVDPTRIGLSGHSMGTWSSWSVAAAYAGAVNEKGQDISPKATVLQCGELFRDSVYDNDSIYFNNVLLLQAKYDEFSYFRDYEKTVSDDLLKSDLRTEFLKTTADQAAWNTTYGSVQDGTARRIELLMTNHRLTTHNNRGLTTAIDWFTEALGIQTDLASSGHIAMLKEWLNLLALFTVLAASLVFMELLLTLRFFAPVAHALPDQAGIRRGGKWWGPACVAILLSGLTYPFMTQLGHGLLPLPEGVFRMTVGNGFLSWYGFLVIINIVMLLAGKRRAKKKGLAASWFDYGLSSSAKPEKIDWMLVLKAGILAVLMALLVYCFTWLCSVLFKLDLRIIWPMFRPFNAMRLGQFFVYLWVFVLFFLFANSKALAQLRGGSMYRKGAGAFLRSWLRCAFVMAGGIILIVLLEYIPFFMDLGPGADLLFSPTFGGPFMSLMILLLPQIIVYSFLDTYCYRRTGNVYTGAFLAGILGCWIVTGGSSFL